jgi:hypothetical protein
MASGLIAGGSLAGILLASLEVPVAFVQSLKSNLNLSKHLGEAWGESNIPALVAFTVVCLALLAVGLSSRTTGETKKARLPEPGLE